MDIVQTLESSFATICDLIDTGAQDMSIASHVFASFAAIGMKIVA